MEPLWSPVVATGGNRSQIRLAQKPPKQAKTLAVGCDQLPIEVHGKEGVDGSSPSDGLQNPRMSGDSSAAGAYTFGSAVIPEQVLHDRVVLITADGEVQLQRRGLSIWPRPVRSEGKRREVPARQEEDHHGAVPVVRAQRRGRGR